MKYIMLIYEPLEGPTPSPESLQKIHMICENWHQRLVESGKSAGCAGLSRLPRTTTISKVNGRLAMIDGPYIESKEVLGGFEILECVSIEEATKIASTFPALDWGLRVELRALIDQDAMRAKMQA